MRKKMIELEERIYILRGETFEGEEFYITKQTTVKTHGINQQRLKPKTNVALLIDGVKSDIDFASLFYPENNFELPGINHVRGYSVIQEMGKLANNDQINISADGIPIGFYHKKTGLPVKLVEIKTPNFQMSDIEIPEETMEKINEYLRNEHERNLELKAEQEKQSKFNPETEAYQKERTRLALNGWTEYRNGNFRLLSKNKDAMLFIVNPGITEQIEFEEDPEGGITFKFGDQEALAHVDGSELIINMKNTVKPDNV